jgi:hypothetical protein
MELNNNDRHIIRNLTFYKSISIIAMFFGFVRFVGAIYEYFLNTHENEEALLNNEIIFASMVVFFMGYLMYLFVSIIKKLKEEMKL